MDKNNVIIIGEEMRPQSKCPHCHKVVMLDLRPWMENMSLFVRSHCPYCRGEIFTALLILSHGNPEGLANTIMNMAAVVNKDRVNYVGGEKGDEEIGRE